MADKKNVYYACILTKKIPVKCEALWPIPVNILVYTTNCIITENSW